MQNTIISKNIANDILSKYWNLQLPVRVDIIAQNMGLKLFPKNDLNYVGKFFSSNDPFNKTGSPAIAFNTNESIAVQRFTIAHELGHFCLGHGSSPIDKIENLGSFELNYNEYNANQFAFHLLMPYNSLRMMIKNGKDNTEKLSQIFGLSETNVSYHILNLSI